MQKEISKIYDPKVVEEKLYQHWLDKKYFKAEVNPNKKPYTIVIPPPNVTSILHMGHAFNNTLQDILIRFKRKLGFEALWLPGTDHAGIATQTVVERDLKNKEHKSRLDLGREKFEQPIANLIHLELLAVRKEANDHPFLDGAIDYPDVGDSTFVGVKN